VEEKGGAQQVKKQNKTKQKEDFMSQLNS